MSLADPESDSTRLAQIIAVCSARLGCARLGTAGGRRTRLRLACSSSAWLCCAARSLATRRGARFGTTTRGSTTACCTPGRAAISSCAATRSRTAIGSAVRHCRTRCCTAAGLRTGAGGERHPAYNCKKTGQFYVLHGVPPFGFRCAKTFQDPPHTFGGSQASRGNSPHRGSAAAMRRGSLSVASA